MNRHTKTPWEIGLFWDSPHRRRLSQCELTAVGEMGVLAHIYRPDVSSEEGEANAEFIVRACNSHAELLAACEAYAQLLEEMIVNPRKDRNRGLNLLAVLKRGQTAIAKAKGTQ